MAKSVKEKRGHDTVMELHLSSAERDWLVSRHPDGPHGGWSVMRTVPENGNLIIRTAAAGPSTIRQVLGDAAHPFRSVMRANKDVVAHELSWCSLNPSNIVGEVIVMLGDPIATEAPPAKKPARKKRPSKKGNLRNKATTSSD